MKNKPYGVISDVHLHEWSAFASYNERGVNSRLTAICDAILEADNAVWRAGGDTLFIAGDLFHTQSAVPSVVLNAASETIAACGCKVVALDGNHDLASVNSQPEFSANAAIGAVFNDDKFVHVSERPYCDTDNGVWLFPWMEDTGQLIELMREYATVGGGDDAIIHAPTEGVLPHLSGISGEVLASIGFNRIYIGHYHNYMELVKGRVYSVGALTHQTWKDVDSTAGFLIADDAIVRQQATSHPRFVNLDMESLPPLLSDLKPSVEGNYVRVRGELVDEGDKDDLKAAIREQGALEVLLQTHAPKTTLKRDDVLLEADSDLEASAAEYVSAVYDDNYVDDLLDHCSDILERARREVSE